MLWKALFALVSMVVSPFRGPVDPDEAFEVTRYGPQSLEAWYRAREALQGLHDDIRYSDEDEPSYAGKNGTQYRWPGYPGRGEIPYILHPDVAKDQKLVKLIDAAMKQYHDNTCIRFVKRTTQKSYVKIIKDGAQCYSHVGKVANPQPQPLSLGPGCEFVGTVVHELGHAIGLYHEHQRSDRDRYITVYKQNIHPNATRNFDKTNPINELKWANYDYTSIMHYGEYAFSVSPRKLKTMVAKDGKTKLLEPYDRPGLNNNDIDLVNKLYKCP